MEKQYGMYANVIVDISHEKVDRPFQYRIPNCLRGVLKIGMEVEIPFGRGNTPRKGYVIEITDQSEYEEEKIKEILHIVEKKQSVEGQMIQVANYMKEQYGTTMIAALRTVLPVKHQVNHIVKRTVTLVTTEKYAQEQLVVFQQKKQVARVRLLEQLLKNPTLSYEWLVKECKLSKATFDALEEQRLITVTSKNEYRNPLQRIQKDSGSVNLSDQQQQIIDTIEMDAQKNQLGNYLIHGITGSGKTEVYLRLIEGVIERKQQAIVLIPEIALTYQTASRFYNRFGERVSILNSKMSAGERYDQIERAKNGELDVMIGPRSALFTPFEQLGLIIIDEEHENSYRSEQVPKYQARDVAYYYASLQGAGVVLGSATPSVETYYKVQQGEIRLFELTTRLTGGQLPHVFVEDMRAELKSGNCSMFSRKLELLLRDRLDKKEQVMLFLNRRGLSGFTSCRSCGHVVKCIHCDISLSKHGNGKMMCHYCGYEESSQMLCPSCNSKHLREFKIGTQQVVEYVQKKFPQANVMRMDSDTTSQKHQYETLLHAFEQQEADILVGTQMIIKGHDFKNVTLVGIMAADISLNASDYTAGEKTFQILTQAAGRAGRGSKVGAVVIQTYQPEQDSIQYAKNHDFKGFYQGEICYRQMMKYPPVAQMMGILVMAKVEERASIIAQEIADFLSMKIDKKRTQLIGPTEARLKKAKDFYRFSLYIKDADYQYLIQLKELVEEHCILGKQELIQYDYNPMGGY